MSNKREELVAIAVQKTYEGNTLYGIEYLDVGYEWTEWFVTKTERDLYLDKYIAKRLNMR